MPRPRGKYKRKIINADQEFVDFIRTEFPNIKGDVKRTRLIKDHLQNEKKASAALFNSFKTWLYGK